jgi:hypothetical protein
MQNEEKTDKQLKKENKELLKENKRLIKENEAARAIAEEKANKHPCENYWFRRALYLEKEIEKRDKQIENMNVGISVAVIKLDMIENNIVTIMKEAKACCPKK